MRAALLLSLFVVSGALADDPSLRYLPSDAKVVLTIHVGRLAPAERDRGKALLRQAYQTYLCPTLKKDDPLPVQNLEKVVFSLPYAGTLNGVIVVRGKIDRKRFEQQMRLAARGGRRVSVEKLGKPAVPVFACKINEKALFALVPELARIPPAIRNLVAPQYLHVAVLDDSTLIASLAGIDPLRRALRARPEKSAPRISAELAKLLREPHRSDVATLVVMDDSLHPGLQLIADSATRETFEQFDFVRLHVRGGKEVEIEAVVQGKSSDLGPVLEKKTKRVLDILSEIIPKVMADVKRRAVIGKLVKALKVDRSEGRVTVKGTMSEADVKTFGEGEKKGR